jgi:hypothetical protein
MSSTGITEKMWMAYGLVYATEKKKKVEWVADWMSISTEEVETLLANMEEIEPGLFTDITKHRIRPDYKTKRLGPEDDSVARKTGTMRDTKATTTTELIEGLKKIAHRNGVSCVQLAAGWVKIRPLTDNAVIEALKAAQAIETETVSGWILSTEDVKEIERLIEESQTQ